MTQETTHLREETIFTVDTVGGAVGGHKLGATVYGQPGRPLIIISSAMGVRRRYYYSFAQYASARGYSVVTFDYRGIGGSRPRSLRGFQATLSDWGKHDVDAVIRWSLRELRPSSITIVGHSAGGQISALAPAFSHVSRFAIIAGQSGYWKHWNGLRRLGLRFFWTASPLLARLLGYFPLALLGAGEQIPRGVSEEWAKWGLHPRYLIGYAGELDISHYETYDRPLLVWSFSDDHFAPKRAADALAAEFPLAQLTRWHREEPGIGHFGFFREKVGGELWEQLLDWIEGKGKY